MSTKVTNGATNKFQIIRKSKRYLAVPPSLTFLSVIPDKRWPLFLVIILSEKGPMYLPHSHKIIFPVFSLKSHVMPKKPVKPRKAPAKTGASSIQKGKST